MGISNTFNVSDVYKHFEKNSFNLMTSSLLDGALDAVREPTSWVMLGDEWTLVENVVEVDNISKNHVRT